MLILSNVPIRMRNTNRKLFVDNANFTSLNSHPYFLMVKTETLIVVKNLSYCFYNNKLYLVFCDLFNVRQSLFQKLYIRFKKYFL